jgi:hypothetical protein
LSADHESEAIILPGDVASIISNVLPLKASRQLEAEPKDSSIHYVTRPSRRMTAPVPLKIDLSEILLKGITGRPLSGPMIHGA